nr:unnamed protein product [Callosobruchus chinensis]
MNVSRIPSLFSRLHGQDLLIKNSSKGPVKSIPRNIEALKKKQKAYQVDDGQVIWRKSRGDVLLYQATLGLTFLGLGMSLHTFWQLSFGKHFQ